MKKTVLSIVAILILAVVVVVHMHFMDRGKRTTEAVFTDLARFVSDNVLVSDKDPAIAMRFDAAFRHLGGQKFVLYGVADTEQHFFVETTADDKLKSVYWIQFEAYLPDNSYRYDYDDSPLRLDIGGYEFYVDTAPVRSNPKKRRAGTDGARAREFLKSKGYSIPQDYAYARLVYLTDDTQRKELMVIFIDDLAPLGLSGSDLKDDGKAAQRWPEIEENHLNRIRQSMALARRQAR